MLLTQQLSIPCLIPALPTVHFLALQIFSVFSDNTFFSCVPSVMACAVGYTRTGPSFWSGIFPHSHGPFPLQLLRTLVWPNWRSHSNKPAQNVHLSKPGNGFSFGECSRVGKGGNREGQMAVQGEKSKQRTKINRQINLHRKPQQNN